MTRISRGIPVRTPEVDPRSSTFRDACPSRVRGCRSAIRRLSEFVSEPCPTVSERLRGVRAVARLCLVCEGTPRITSDNQPCPRTCLGCPSLSERVLAHPTVSERKLFMYSFLSLTLPYTHSTPTTRTLCSRVPSSPLLVTSPHSPF